MRSTATPDRKPLMSELILEALKKQELQRARKRRNWYWGSTKCSILLGLGHLLGGIVLLIYDLATNSITESKFAISSSLCFIICAILLFISARRTGLDRPAHYLIIIFSVISCIMAVLLIGGTAYHANKICIAIRTVKCTLQSALIHAFLILIVFLEMGICLCSIYGSYSFLQRLSNQITNLIYRSLITEDFNRLPTKHRPDEQISLITAVEEGSSPSAPSSLKTA
ncbi:hypothetical protein M3Y97_00547700 [Aphelenchoides bicaudatus]|nr:hypothetical protein M3Y97_00547700 [Aphelenchoides bicaudatus]